MPVSKKHAEDLVPSLLWLVVAAFLAAIQSAWGQTARPDLIGFKSSNLELKGFIWKPFGEGPFPALLWNHGSEKSPGPVDTVAPFFVSIRKQRIRFFRTAPPGARTFAGTLHHG